MAPLTPNEERWLKWAESLPAFLSEAMINAQPVSIPSFEGGIRDERARIRRELEATIEEWTIETNGQHDYEPPSKAWPKRLRAVMDRVAPEEG